jgi:hypothetical protein
MDLLQNPFFLLAASPRDNRRRLTELADERSLLLDSSDCMEARSSLTNPRKRLSAEVAWLPDIGPKRAMEVLSILESSPLDLLAIDKLPSVSKANLLSAGLARLQENRCGADDIANWIQELAWSFENIDIQKLCLAINEGRVVSGFPEVSDLAVIESEIQERRRYYRNTIKSALDNLAPKELVNAVTIAVEEATEGGEVHGPILLADLVDSYEVEAQEFLDTEEQNIKTLVDKLRGAVNADHQDSILSSIVNLLIQVVKNWDLVAQPIQVSAKSRGLDHDASHRVAWLVRNLAIDMFNDYGKIDYSQQLTSMLREVFAEVGEVAERTADDAVALEDIIEQRARLIEDAKSNAEEWRREIAYEVDIGVIFKDKLRISTEGIDWKGRSWDLESITRLRWGGTKHSVNGIPSGTTYSVSFGNSSGYETIELKKELVYSNFIDRLWKAVGVRLLTEYLEGLRDGREYRFGSAVMSDQGMELERQKLFDPNERIFCRWSELVIWNDAGAFCIGKKDDKKLSAELSYQEEDNIHVLEAMIRMFWKQGGEKLSGLLEQ